MKKEPTENKTIPLIEKYEKNTSLRAAVQLIPYIGSPLDTLFSGRASKIQQTRILSFIEDLNNRLKRIELVKQIEPTEEFYDFMFSVLDGVQRSRSDKKRKKFAEIVKNKIMQNNNWEEAETATRLLTQLDYIHIEILKAAIYAPLCEEPFAGKRVITIIIESSLHDKTGNKNPLYIPDLFSEQSIETIMMICSELVSRGLLKDEGVENITKGSMEYFSATVLAKWFLRWLGDENK